MIPAAGAGRYLGRAPGTVVNSQNVPERRPSDRPENAPGGDQVRRRITGTRATEVDHRAERSVRDQHVGPQQVGMNPDWAPGPERRLQRQLPGGFGSVAVDQSPAARSASRVSASNSGKGRRPAGGTDRPGSIRRRASTNAAKVVAARTSSSTS